MKKLLLTWFLYLFVKILNFTYRYNVIGKENFQKAKDQSPYKTFVVAVFHQNIVSALTFFIGKSMALIVSASKDGEFFTLACEKMGHVVARGSTSRNGKAALLECIKNMKNGYEAAMAVDGPRGPAFVVKPGTVEMARVTQSAVIPWTAIPENAWHFRSWDKFRLAKPFTKINVLVGEPIFVPENLSEAEFENYQKQVADAILNLEKDFLKNQNL